MLTQHSKKDIKHRIAKLEKYYEFYGYHISDPMIFEDLMKQLIQRTEVALNKIVSYRSFENSYQLCQKVMKVNNLKAVCKESPCDYVSSKSKRYVLNNHIITPLMMASVNMVERSLVRKIGQETPVKTMENKFQALSIDDNLSDISKPKPSIGSSITKRNHMELQKMPDSNYDLFSSGVLNAISTYMDYVSAKVHDNSKYCVIGRFAVILYELKEKELKDVHKRINIDMPVDDISMRVIKPYKQFYNTLINVALKFDLNHLSTVTTMDYINAVQYQMAQNWNESLHGPAEYFFACCKKYSKDVKDKGIGRFFEVLRGKLIQTWNLEVILKSESFKRAKLE